MDMMIVVPWVLLLFVVLIMVWMALGNKVTPDQLKALLNAIYQSKPVQEWKDEHWDEVESKIKDAVEDCLVEQKTYKLWKKWFNDEPSEEEDDEDAEDEKPKEKKDKKGKKSKKEAEPDGEKAKGEDEDSEKEESVKPTPSDKPSKDKDKEKAKEEIAVKTEKKEDLKKAGNDVDKVLKELEGEKKKKDDD